MNKENIHYQQIISNIEYQIKNQQFKTKEDLHNYIIEIKNKFNIPEELLSNEKILELLKLYDLHNNKTTELDLRNYKGVNLDNQNLIINQNDHVVLKTNSSNEELTNEFTKIQNETYAQSKDSTITSDEIFKTMQNDKKEQLDFISLYEIPQYENIDIEILKKINFFISNKYINPYSFKVNPTNGYFYNIEDHTILEVRQNKETGLYEIFKGEEIVYNNSTQELNSANEEIYETQEILEENNEEEQIYENKNVKTKRLIKAYNQNNAAFAKSSLIIIIVLFTSIIIALSILS